MTDDQCTDDQWVQSPHEESQPVLDEHWVPEAYPVAAAVDVVAVVVVELPPMCQIEEEELLSRLCHTDNPVECTTSFDGSLMVFHRKNHRQIFHSPPTADNGSGG